MQKLGPAFLSVFVGEGAEASFQRPQSGTRWGFCFNVASLLGEFVLDTDASGVINSGTHHQRQVAPSNCKLQSNVFGSDELTPTQVKNGAPKNEMDAAYVFLKKKTVTFTCVPANSPWE